MKLILINGIGDGFTYFFDIPEPFEYESVEKAQADLKTIFEEAHHKDQNVGTLCFCGIHIDINTLCFYKNKEVKPYYLEPTILELNEWFEKYKAEK